MESAHHHVDRPAGQGDGALDDAHNPRADASGDDREALFGADDQRLFQNAAAQG